MSVSTLLGSPGLRGIIISNSEGKLVGEIGTNADAEGAAAVIAVVDRELKNAGGSLGLGQFLSAIVKTPRHSRVIAEQGDVIAMLDLDPGRPTGAIEALLRESEWASRLREGIADISDEVESVDVEIDVQLEDDEHVAPQLPNPPKPAPSPSGQRLASVEAANSSHGPLFRNRQVPPDAQILDDTWDIEPVLRPVSDPLAELRRALVRGDVDTAQSIGNRLFEADELPTGDDGERKAKQADLEALRGLLGGIATAQAGDGRGAVMQWRTATPLATIEPSILWARQIWLARTQCRTGLPIAGAQADADIAQELASALDSEARALTLLIQAEIALCSERSEQALSFARSARELFADGYDQASLAGACFLEARALAELRRDEDSRAAADAAHSHHPSWPAPVVFMAQQALRSGHLLKVDAMLRPLRLHTPPSREVDRIRTVLDLIKKSEITTQEAYEFLKTSEARPDGGVVSKLDDWAARLPHCHVFREALAGVLLRLGDYDRAADEFKRVSLDPELTPDQRSAILLSLGCLTTVRSRHEKTGVKLRAAVLATPEPLRTAASARPPDPDVIQQQRHRSSPAAQLELSVLAGAYASGTMPVAANLPMAMRPNGPAHGSVFSGSLRTFCLADILEFLRNGQRTGTLVCASDAGIGAFQLRSGRITGGASPNMKGLGEWLVQVGGLSESQLNEVLSRHATDGSKELLGRILIEERLVTPEQVREGLREQVRSAVKELMGWPEGQFAFDAEAVVAPSSPSSPSPSEIDIELDPQALMLDIFRQIDEVQR